MISAIIETEARQLVDALRDREVTVAVMPLVDLTLMMKRERALQGNPTASSCGALRPAYLAA